MSELRRLIVRHRHVAPMVSALLAGTDAAVTIRDADGEIVLQRGGVDAGDASHDVTVDGEILGRVDGGRIARGIAAVLSYAAARERDKRSLANEALERYRELSLIYDLAAAIGGHSDLDAIVGTAVAELSRLPNDARGFLFLLRRRRCAPGGRRIRGDRGTPDRRHVRRRHRRRHRRNRRRRARRAPRRGPARHRRGAPRRDARCCGATGR